MRYSDFDFTKVVRKSELVDGNDNIENKEEIVNSPIGCLSLIGEIFCYGKNQVKTGLPKNLVDRKKCVYSGATGHGVCFAFEPLSSLHWFDLNRIHFFEATKCAFHENFVSLQNERDEEKLI